MRPFRVDFCGSELPCRPSPSRGYQRPRTPSERSWQVREAGEAFQSDVKVHCKDIMADGRSILSLVCLAAECGTMLALEAQGCDAEDAVVALANLISARVP